MLQIFRVIKFNLILLKQLPLSAPTYPYTENVLDYLFRFSTKPLIIQKFEHRAIRMFAEI